MPKTRNSGAPRPLSQGYPEAPNAKSSPAGIKTSSTPRQRPQSDFFFFPLFVFFREFFCCFFPPEVGEDKGTPKGTRGSGLVSETPIPGLSRGGREGFYGVSTSLRFHGIGGAERGG